MDNYKFTRELTELQNRNKKIQKAFIKTLLLFLLMIVFNIAGLYVNQDTVVHTILICIMPVYTFFATYTITRMFQDLHY